MEFNHCPMKDTPGFEAGRGKRPQLLPEWRRIPVMRGSRLNGSRVSDPCLPLGSPILHGGEHCFCHRYLAVQPGFKAGPARLSGLLSKVVLSLGHAPRFAL